MPPRIATVPALLVLGLSTAAAQSLEPFELPARPGMDRPDSLEPMVPTQQQRGPAQAQPQPTADSASVLNNEQIIAMVDARFSDSTIIAAMKINATEFNVSPGGLLTLKNAGVPDRIIEAMIDTELHRRSKEAESRQAKPETAAGDPDEDVQTMTPETIAALSAAIRQAAAQPDAGTAAAVTVHDVSDAVPMPTGPRAWVAGSHARTELQPQTAEVALTDDKGRGASAFNVLRGLGEKALAFATPALGIGSELEVDGLFRNGDPKVTAVWALPGAMATRSLAPDAVFEVDFNNIPGVNPNNYYPCVVALVPTRDNYRLVGAARARLSELDAGLPEEPIVEESVATDVRMLSRGRFRVALDADMPPGEYALVLRPVDRPRTGRDDSTSLSTLMGTGSSDILYITWDFSVRAG